MRSMPQPGGRRPVAEPVARAATGTRRGTRRRGRRRGRRGRSSGPTTSSNSRNDPGPPVGEHEGQRAGVRGAGVDGVDAQPVDVDPDLGQRGQARLGGAPVVAVPPVVDEVAQVGEGDALRPVVDGGGVGPAGGVEAAVEVGQVLVGHPDGEGVDVAGRGSTLTPSVTGRPVQGPERLVAGGVVEVGEQQVEGDVDGEQLGRRQLGPAQRARRGPRGRAPASPRRSRPARWWAASPVGAAGRRSGVSESAIAPSQTPEGSIRQVVSVMDRSS